MERYEILEPKGFFKNIQFESFVDKLAIKKLEE